MADGTLFKTIGKHPDTQNITWDFAEGKTMSWEGRSCNDYPVEGRSRGTLIYGTEGTALLDGDEYIIYDKNKKIIKQAKGNRSGGPNQHRQRQRRRAWTLRTCQTSSKLSAVNSN